MVKRTLSYKLLWNSNKKIEVQKDCIHENAFEYVVCEKAVILARGRWAKHSFAYEHKHILAYGYSCSREREDCVYGKVDVLVTNILLMPLKNFSSKLKTNKQIYIAELLLSTGHLNNDA